MRKVLLTALLTACPIAANAATLSPTTLQGKDAIPSIQYFGELTGTYASQTALFPMVIFCDATTVGQCAAINSSGQLAIQAPPSLPLPSGAATSANQTAVTSTPGTAPVPAEAVTVQGNASGIAVPVSGTFWQATQPVSGTVTANAGTGTFTVGQATGTNLHMVCDSGCSSASSPSFGAAFASTGTPIGGEYFTTPPTYTNNTFMEPFTINSHGAMTVDGSAVTQPISAASLPLPSGAATSANQTNASQKTQIVDGSGNVIGSTSNALNVNCTGCSAASTVDIKGNSGATLDATLAAGTAPTNGIAVLGQYNSTLPTLTNGQTAARQVDSNGRAIISPTNLTLPDNTAFTFGSSGQTSGSAIDCVYQSAATSNPLTAGNQGTAGCTQYRGLFANLRDSTGTELANTTLHAVPTTGFLTGSGAATQTMPEVCTGTPNHVNSTATGDFALVAASSGKTVHLCDYDFSAAGASAFYLEYSTTGGATVGSSCTGTFTQISITWTLVANESKTGANPYYRGVGAPSGDPLCVHVSSVTTGLDVGVYYNQ